MSPEAHQPDPSQRRQVEAMAAYGIPEVDISRVMGIDPRTLRNDYRDELDLGQTKANAQVAGFLFNAAKNGNVTAQIFWLKTRARWKEPPTDLNHSGAVGTFNLDKLSYKELQDLQAVIQQVRAERAADAADRDGGCTHALGIEGPAATASTGT